MSGHRYAVRRLRYSPHKPGVFATASYDMSVILWDSQANPGGGREGGGGGLVLERCLGHTEFVAGVAFSLLEPPLMATCAFDRRLCFWSW
ncbi:unnamed protein product [Laminaria digitata]